MKKRNNKEMDIVLLLDRSGSMSGLEDSTICGYNSYLKSQCHNNVRVTTILFDDKYEVLCRRKKIQEMMNLTRKEYYVRGSTALFDAIGCTINYLDRVKAKKVIFIIITDGLENSSVEYSKSKIRQLIQNHYKWEFMYIGANIDSYIEGEKLGIKKDNISNYMKSKIGVKKLFSSIDKASESFYCDGIISEVWKSDLDNYIDNNISFL